MKLNILTELIDGPWGGGNQFLKVLKKESLNRGEYTNIQSADVILFNGHQDLYKVIDCKKKYPRKIFIHRIDGPMDYRGSQGIKLDKKIFFVNKLVADGTVFQSQWSFNNTDTKLFDGIHKVIHNAPDQDIFHNKKMNKNRQPNDKIKLVAVSWSSNSLKGFDIYHYLDKYLDFNKYDMNFIGNVDSEFSNINLIKPMRSDDLADFLRSQDIFVFASKREACSNSLLEALHCGLPALVRDCSSNAEVLKDNGVLFKHDNILEKLDELSESIDYYKSKITLNFSEDVYDQYQSFFKEVKMTAKNKIIRNAKIRKLQLKLGII